MLAAVKTLPKTLFAIFLIAISAYSTGAIAQFSSKSVVTTPQVRAELMAHAPDGVVQGKPLWVGLQLRHQPDWHTYWKNPGDSGLATVLDWTLPAGVSAGEIGWPVPHLLRIGNLANYGYEGTLLLSVPLTIGPDFKPSALGGDLEVKLKASWLVCRKECIPEDGEFALRLPLRSATALNGAQFEAAFAAQPRPVLSGTAGAIPDSHVRIDGNAIALTVQGLPAALRGKTLAFFPETPEVIETAAAWTQGWNGAVWTARVPLSPQRSNSPSLMPVVLAADGQGWRTELKVKGNWPAVASTTAGTLATGPSTPLPPALEAALKANADTAGAPTGAIQGSATSPLPATLSEITPATPPAASLTLLGALLGALLGGLILNLMPCVFPVLAIKLISFTQLADGHGGAGQDGRGGQAGAAGQLGRIGQAGGGAGGAGRSALRAQGLAYTLGVVVSFLALGGLLLVLRLGGEQLGWGFQLQSPAMVATLAVLFTLIALNLFGVYDVGMLLPSRVGTVQARHPAANAFLSGVLAVAIASPCTAPFMGASLGFAVSLPASQAMLVFGAIGLGMALPYLAASLAPGIVRLLPRPGAWMVVFRTLMGFPMLATVAWLVWVLGQQTGIDGAGALLALLLLLSMAVWALTLQGRSRSVVAGLSLAALVAATLGIGPAVIDSSQTSAPPQPVAGTPASAEQGQQGQEGQQAQQVQLWQPWQPGRVEQLQAAGQTVFVDFTAAWCVTCQYNKKTTLADATVLADLAAKNITLLRADWTRRDPAIAAALSQLGRSGVPVYVFYKAGHPPVLLSELPSTGEIRAAIAKL